MARVMAINRRTLECSSEEVWGVLADGQRYADWVVGAKRVRGVEPGWPAVGSKFHHTVGVWPLRLRDNTVVLACENGKRLVLEARIRPFGRARIELTLTEIETGTEVEMQESPSSPAVVRMADRLLDPLIHTRNVEALRRLDSICRNL